MDEAAAQAAGRTADGHNRLATVSEALEALRAKWGDARIFGHGEQGYWAAGHPGSGVLRAGTPEELDALCAGEPGAGAP